MGEPIFLITSALYYGHAEHTQAGISAISISLIVKCERQLVIIKNGSPRFTYSSFLCVFLFLLTNFLYFAVTKRIAFYADSREDSTSGSDSVKTLVHIGKQHKTVVQRSRGKNNTYTCHSKIESIL